MEYLRSIWEQINRVVNCLSCTEDLNNLDYESTERTHLLTTDTSSQSPAIIRQTSSEQFSRDACQSLPKKNDQNALCLLVQNTAIQMIDVGAMDAHNLENHEFDDRVKLYSLRLHQQWSNLKNPVKSPSFLLKDIPDPEIFLEEQVGMNDLTEMRAFMQTVHIALSEIKVEHKDPIVVPFQIMQV